VNEAIALQGKRSRAELLGGKMTELYPGIEHTEVFRRIQSVMESGEPDRLENEFTFPDGSIGWFELSMQRVPDGVLILSMDITPYKRAGEEIRRLNADLSRRVEERTAELVASNQELEAFAYSISHDLRAPLRAIDGFCRMIIEGYADRLDDEGRRLLEVVRANAQKMGDLIHAVLGLSRVAREDLQKSPVNMRDMAEAAYREVIAQGDGAEFEWSLSELPEALGDPALLRQVWTNLLSNAVKYTRPKAGRRITVGATTEPGWNTYSVADTGVGFSPEHSHKLFGVFQRLHTEREFEGLGVGLALVQRIIRRHGGKVWAEAEEGRGATFYFSLPAGSPPG
jgi:signal transduction histidine kinase